ncbi:hypothetical protein JCM3775_000778 [Rhodotorula graminis]
MASMPSFDYVDDPPQPLVCPICRDPLDDPVTTPTCQHMYCRTCLDRALQLAPSCPVCRTRLDSLDNCPDAPRAILHLVADLAIQCTTCSTHMRRDDWSHHACPSSSSSSSSSSSVDRTDPDHCDLCSQDIPHDDAQNHASLCPAAHVPCAYCALHLPRASHPAHLLSTCPAVPSPCPHAPHGCPWLGPRSSSSSASGSTALDDHLAHECVYEPLRDYLALVDGRMRELEGDNWALRARVRRCEDALDEVRALAGALRGAMGEFAPLHVGASGDGGEVKPQRAMSRSPTRRARTPPRPSSPSLPPPSGPAAPAPTPTPPSSSLPATLAALSSTTASHTSQLASLAHAHAQHAQHAADELAGVRAQLAGVRQQVAQWAMLLHDRERERERERERDEWARASWARRTGLGTRSTSDEAPFAPHPHAHAHAAALGDSGGSSGSDDEYGAPPSAAAASSSSRAFGPPPLPPLGSSYPGGGAGTYPSTAFRRAPHLALPPGLRLVPQHELLGGGGGGGGWDGGGVGAYGYGVHEPAAPAMMMLGGLAGGGGGGGAGAAGGGGGGPGRARGVPIPMGGAGAVKL